MKTGKLIRLILADNKSKMRKAVERLGLRELWAYKCEPEPSDLLLMHLGNTVVERRGK